MLNNDPDLPMNDTFPSGSTSRFIEDEPTLLLKNIFGEFEPDLQRVTSLVKSDPPISSLPRGVVVPIPTLVALSYITPVDSVVAPVNLAT